VWDVAVATSMSGIVISGTLGNVDVTFCSK